MKTKCPQCQTQFNVLAEQLKVRNGTVRCGVCSHIFNAYEHLLDDIPEVPVLNQRSQAQYQAEPPPLANNRMLAPAPVPEPFYEDELEPQISGHDHANGGFFRDQDRYQHSVSLGGNSLYTEPRYDPNQGGIRADNRRAVAPSYVNSAPKAMPSSQSSGGLGYFPYALVALVVFVLQFSYVFRNQLGNLFPALQPKLVQLCGFANCELGFKASDNALKISNSSLSQTGKAADGSLVMRLQLNLQNTDAKATTWPGLVLTLKNAQGAISARKIIKPDTYLSRDQLNQTFAANSQITLDLPVKIQRYISASGFELNLFSL